MTDLTLLHTADVHRATFDALRDRIAPKTVLNHIVRPDLLVEARMNGITAELDAGIGAIIQSAPSPVLCTCTTIGQSAARYGALRVDRPMMEIAAKRNGAVLMAYCLRSTLVPSLTLWREITDKPCEVLDLAHLWPLFEAGEYDQFARAIAAAISDACTHQNYGTVILTQASMAGAAPLIECGDALVLASPEIALRHALGLPLPS